MTSQNSVNLGNRPIKDGETVSMDHVVHTFMVQVRSMSNVGEDTIKDLIQKKFEVSEIKKVDETFFVRGPSIPDFAGE